MAGQYGATLTFIWSSLSDHLVNLSHFSSTFHLHPLPRDRFFLSPAKRCSVHQVAANFAGLLLDARPIIVG